MKNVYEKPIFEVNKFDIADSINAINTSSTVSYDKLNSDDISNYNKVLGVDWGV
jgi:hypothetical protein